MKDVSQKDRELNLPLSTRAGEKPRLQIGNSTWEPGTVAMIGGPCTVESRAQVLEIASAVKDAGGFMLRGGIFKPLTFPYGDPLARPDRGESEEGYDRSKLLAKSDMLATAERRLGYLKEAGERTGLPVVSEILYADTVDLMSPYVDMFQVGYRHMFNMDMIEALARSGKPILLKRHYGESLRSLLGVVEHFFVRGKTNLAVCERGVATSHTHNTHSRAIFDIQVIPAIAEQAPTVPIFADPSHSTFTRSFVAPISLAAVAAGADGLLIDVHGDPETAWVDPLQALNYKAFAKLVRDAEKVAAVIGKRLA